MRSYCLAKYPPGRSWTNKYSSALNNSVWAMQSLCLEKCPPGRSWTNKYSSALNNSVCAMCSFSLEKYPPGKSCMNKYSYLTTQANVISVTLNTQRKLGQYVANDWSLWQLGQCPDCLFSLSKTVVIMHRQQSNQAWSGLEVN